MNPISSKVANADINWIYDPNVFEVNRLNPKTHFYAYEPDEDFHYGQPSRNVMNLNGSWKFSFYENVGSYPEHFYEERFDCRAWRNIKVPSHIQMHGYDKPCYLMAAYPWDGLEELYPPEIPKRFNPVGTYVKYFDLPDGFDLDKRFYISFQGVETAFYVWLNGHFVGYSEDSFTASDFELTQHIRRNDNKLAVLVLKHTTASWLEDHDFFRFSGIFRDVYIYARPHAHIYDFTAKPSLMPDNMTGLLDVELCLSGYMPEMSAVVSVYDMYDVKKLDETSFTNFHNETLHLSLPVEDITPWSAEYPFLYLMVISLAKNGKIIEQIPYRIGFRRFELIEGIMCLNGRRIEMKGVNRHEFSHVHGRCLTATDMLWDVVQMKRHNINAVCTSYVPASPIFYDLCDEYGLYVMDETNLCTSAIWRNGKKNGNQDETVWESVFLDRVMNLYHRDKNHPSILIWSLGNETYCGESFKSMHKYLKERDQTRLVHYHGEQYKPAYSNASDIHGLIMPPVDMVEEFCRNYPDKPLILTKYGHTLANACANIADYQELMYRIPYFQGGFIYDFIDQALLARDRFGNDFLGYGGDFDDIPNDGYFSGKGIVFANRELSPKISEVKACYQSVGFMVDGSDLIIKNNYLFTNLNYFKLVVSVYFSGVFLGSKSFITDVSPDCDTRLSGVIVLPDSADFGEYVFDFSLRTARDEIWCEAGHEIAFSQYIIDNNPKPYMPLRKRMTIARSPHNIGVHGEHFSCVFSKTKGMLSYRHTDEEILYAPPAPNFWRAPTDIDKEYRRDILWAPWKLAGLYAQITDFTINDDAYAPVLTYTYFLPVVELPCVVTYTIYGDGIVKVNMHTGGATHAGDRDRCAHGMSILSGGVPPIPEIGMLLSVPGDMVNLEYYGMGPDENYRDRRTGARLGVFRTNVWNNLTPYIRPQECGNRTGVRHAKLTSADECGIAVFADKPFELCALPYLPHELEMATHQPMLPETYRTVMRIINRQTGIGTDIGTGGDRRIAGIDPYRDTEFEFYFKAVMR